MRQISVTGVWTFERGGGFHGEIVNCADEEGV